MVHIFENFQKMVDNAIMVEHASKEMGEQKRKFESSGQFSNNSRPRKEHLFAPEDRISTTGRINISAPTTEPAAAAASSAYWSVSAASQPSAKLLEHPNWNTCEEQYPCFHWW
jgi:hypothetical protein